MVRGGGASLPCDCDLEMANSDSGAPLVAIRPYSLLCSEKSPSPQGGPTGHYQSKLISMEKSKAQSCNTQDIFNGVL